MTANAKKSAPAGKRGAAAPSQSAGFKPWQTDLAACVLLFAAVFAMFHQIPLENKAFSRGDDTEQAYSMNTFATQETRVREFPLWCPYIFGGFPSFSAGAYSNYEEMGMPYALANRYLSPRYWADLLSIRVLFLGGADEPVHSARWLLSLFLYGSLFTYLLIRRLGLQWPIALMCALIMAWNPYIISLATAAHGGKIMTFIYMPLILLAAWNVLRRRRVFDLALLALALSWQIAVGGHTQVIFYSFVMIGLIYLVWAIFEFRDGGALRAVKAGGLIAAATVLAFAAGALWYLPLYKYVPYSIRGLGPAITAAGQAPAGYSLADATMWSFAPKEIVTFLVPSWFGLKSPYYWGTMPFTSSSFYFGTLPLLFAVLAFFGRKTRLFWGLVAVTVFSLLLAFGLHFESFYSLFFNYLPFFNKFRTPSLILLLVVLAGIVFAGYGIRWMLDLSGGETWRKRFLIASAVCGGLFVVFLLAGDSAAGMFGSFIKDGETTRYGAQQLAQLKSTRMAMLHKDLVLALFWLTLGFAACWLKAAGKLSASVFLAAVLLITAMDLWRFSKQFFEPQPPAQVYETVQPTRTVDFLRKDTTVFRVLPVGRIMQDNRWAAWEISTLGGYHGAKMRRYQDLVDFVLPAGTDGIPLNMHFLNAMNVKYVVAEGQVPAALNLEYVMQDADQRTVLYRNPRAMERAYFVDSVIVLEDRAETIRRLQRPDFPWDYAAIVNKPLPGRIVPTPNRAAAITEYIPHRVRLRAETDAPSLLVLSDAHYELGWRAFVDNEPADIYTVNGYVRGLYLSAGRHDIEFRYAGPYERRGETVATVSHFLVWGLVLGSWWWERKRRRSAA